jgi:hypothetical protein
VERVEFGLHPFRHVAAVVLFGRGGESLGAALTHMN